MNDIVEEAQLRRHMGPVSSLAERKVLTHIDDHSRHFIALSPLLVMATTGADGSVDASPRGDPPGFTRVIDDRTLLVPDRPGNNRADSFSNILVCPQVGLIFFVPGVDETLRINGRARLSTAVHDRLPSQVDGKVPATAIIISVSEVFFHCGKALKRSRLWDPAMHVDRQTFPSLGCIIADQVSGVDRDDADARIERSYRDRLY